MEARMAEPCAPAAGRVVPEIDRTRCEAKEDCVRVCPYHVFEVRRLTDAERQPLGWFARGKLFFHGGQQAFAVREQDCHACGMCVKACPEHAIQLVAVATS